MFKKQGQVGRIEMERRGRRDEGLVLKKGPWTADEDDVLVEFVTKYGPRDWSSIKAKGLLPRSGKSCRLRWVNKLKPDLKTGCKFSTEEERVVLELQARFGNKWARIATYLPGRTDNDVKNFWSTRQKRLARMLQTAHHKKPQRNDGKPPVLSVAPVVQGPSNGFHPCGGEGCSTGECIQKMPNRVDSDATVMIQQQLQDHVRYTMPTVGRTINTPFLQQQEFDRKPCLLDTHHLPQFNFPQLPHALLDLPVLPDGHEMDLGLEGLVGFQDPFSNTDAALGYDLFQLPFIGLEGEECNNGTGVMVGDPLPDTPDSFFDDFPVDMLDNSDLPPPTDGVN